MHAVGLDPDKRGLLAVVVDEQGFPVQGEELDRLEPAIHGTTAEAHLDLKRRALAHFRRLEPVVVAFWGTTKYASWKYADLRPRVLVEAAGMHAAAELGIPVLEAKPHAAAKRLGVAPNDIRAGVEHYVALENFTYPLRRARALAAAWEALDMDPDALDTPR